MPKRRPGIKKNYNLDCKPHLAFFIGGQDTNSFYKAVDGFEDFEHMEKTWEKHRSYLMNLYFYGDESGFIGGYEAGTRPAGWWWCESPIKEYIREGDLSGVIGDSLHLDGKYYEELSEYAVKDKYFQEDPIIFKVNQTQFLKDHDLLFKWEKQKLKEKGD